MKIMIQHPSNYISIVSTQSMSAVIKTFPPLLRHILHGFGQKDLVGNSMQDIII